MSINSVFQNVLFVTLSQTFREEPPCRADLYQCKCLFKRYPSKHNNRKFTKIVSIAKCGFIVVTNGSICLNVYK